MHAVVDPIVIDGAIIGFMAWAVMFILGVFNIWRFRVSTLTVEMMFLLACVGLGASIGWLWP